MQRGPTAAGTALHVRSPSRGMKNKHGGQTDTEGEGEEAASLRRTSRDIQTCALVRSSATSFAQVEKLEKTLQEKLANK